MAWVFIERNRGVPTAELWIPASHLNLWPETVYTQSTKKRSSGTGSDVKIHFLCSTVEYLSSNVDHFPPVSSIRAPD